MSGTPFPYTDYPGTGNFREPKLEFLKRMFLLLSIIRCLLKWWTPAGVNMRISDFFGVFLDLLDTSTE